MSTPADQRLTELLDRWLTSLDLHIRYAALDDDTYWQIQPWVEHQRPARWLLDLAREKTAALRAAVAERAAGGDAGFAEALEQMMFLANLVGLQQIERFIPVADPANERSDTVLATGLTGTREMPQLGAAAGETREMPRPPLPPLPPPAATPLVARIERKSRSAPRKPAAAAATAAAENSARQVAADAVRLLQWGRRWFELAELIARMADRPPVHEVRRLLDENRAKIEKALKDAES
jgi:hypothetical protein